MVNNSKDRDGTRGNDMTDGGGARVNDISDGGWARVNDMSDGGELLQKKEDIKNSISSFIQN